MVEKTQLPPPPAVAPPEPPVSDKPWYDPVLNFFSSVHLAVITLILLAGISIIGTVLQQEYIGDPGDNLRLFQEFFGDAGRAERAFEFSAKIGLFHLYQTWYFYALLGLLSASLIVCSLRRLPVTWQIMARPKIALAESGFKTSPNHRFFSLRLPRAEAAAAVAGILRRGGFQVREGESDGTHQLFAQKGAYSRLGIYVTHFSIILILIGGIIGNLVGFKGFMQINEGTSEDRFQLRGSPGRRATLPFKVRCDDFNVEYYPGTERPKDFYSWLTVIDGGREVLKERIEVNSPLQYDGIWFYQSNYGDSGVAIGIRAVDKKSGAAHDLRLSSNDLTEVPGTGVRLQIQQIFPDFEMDGSRPTSRSSQARNPVVALRVLLPEGTSKLLYLFKLRPDLKTVEGLPVDLTFANFETRQFTGLQVVYDPGVWVIWTGSALMVFGLWFAFFVSHRRLWVRLREDGGTTSVALAGNANKNRERFTEEFERLGDALQAVVESRG